MIRTSVYLILQPVRRGFDGVVTGLEIDRLIKTRPTKLGVRDIALKVNIEVDEALFVSPAPEVTLRLDDRRTLILPTIETAVEVSAEAEPEAVPA